MPEHVGAAARALKTMGMKDLRVVASSAHTEIPARRLAHKSHDILDAIRVHATLKQALADIDFAVATTSRPRMSRRDHYSPPHLLQLLKDKAGSISRVAIVFGPEKRGLTNEDVALCNITSYVPMIARQPSLNLGQAVMVYAYALSELTLAPASPARKADKAEADALRRNASALLEKMELPESDRVHVRILERLSALNAADTRLAQTICKRVGAHVRETT